MFVKLIEEAISGGVATKPTEIPLTHYDVGINAEGNNQNKTKNKQQTTKQ